MGESEPRSHRDLLALGLYIFLMLFAQQGTANENILFEIPKMQADMALKALSRQSDYPVIFRTSEVQSTQTNSVIGLYTVREALQRMFEGTQLQGSLSGEQVVTVTLMASEAPADDVDLPGAQQQTRERPIEEIFVTAQRRRQDVQDVPISISVINELMIEKTDVNDINGLIPMVPGLTGTAVGLGQNAWAIRGISSNDWSIGSEPSVAIFLDGGYMGRNFFAMAPYYDLERIEVVKGPQGTLFGRNAAVGAISLISNKPGDANELHVGLAAGDEGQRRYDVVANLAPSNEFGLRFAYHGDRFEGIWEDVVNDEYVYADNDSFRLTAR